MDNTRKRKIFEKLKIFNTVRSAIGIATALLIMLFDFENVVVVFLFGNRNVLISILIINFLLRIIGHIVSELKVKIDSDLLITNPFVVFGILVFEIVVLSLFQMDLFICGTSGITTVAIGVLYFFSGSVIGKIVSSRLNKKHIK